MALNRTPETRDVYETSLAHDVSFVSAVRSYGNLGPFRPLDRELFKGVRIFDMLIRPEQIICASSVRANQESPLYGNWGVIVGAGDILQAYPYDATSSVIDNTPSSPYSGRLDHLSIDEQIETAIESTQTHNEITIALGKNGIAGLFYKLGTQQGVDDAHYPSPEVESLLQPYNIPSYWLFEGNYYEKNGATVPTSLEKPVPIASVLTSGPSLEPESTFELAKDFLVEELTLPPRNPISAGILRAQSAIAYSRKHQTPIDAFVADVEQNMANEAPDLKTYGAVAVHAFRRFNDGRLESTLPDELVSTAQAVVSDAQYALYSSRVLENGNLRINEADLTAYVRTNALPPYLGKV